MVPLMLVKNNCLKHLAIIVNWLYAVNILEILMKKYIFIKKTSFSDL